MQTHTLPESEETVVYRLDANLDFRNADDFRSDWQAKIDVGARRFILDLSLTSILDSTGLGSIIALYRQVKALGGFVRMAAPSPAVATVLDVTKCDRVFGRYTSVEAALRDRA